MIYLGVAVRLMLTTAAAVCVSGMIVSMVEQLVAVLAKQSKKKKQQNESENETKPKEMMNQSMVMHGKRFQRWL